MGVVLIPTRAHDKTGEEEERVTSANFGPGRIPARVLERAGKHYVT